ncbi:MAG: hypothetical protein KGM42_21585 [Hyphomicrobiales bacterium]|nr:hypothetical protein [Hyphomicrobiales bacterium]
MTEISSEAALPSKVPEITVYFWIIKILATTVGETAADLLAVRLGLGLTMTSWILTGVFVAVLAVQLRIARYIPAPYWITVVLISVVGTLISDNLVDGLGISLVTTSAAFAIILALVFMAWARSEGTLSIHSIVTRKRELFYWLAILFTFALGTSAGDLVAERLDLGYGVAALAFAGAIALVFMAYRLSLAGPIASFWIAYILTRPLGASIGDFLAKPQIAGGLGWGTVNTSLVFVAAILALVAFLTKSGADRIALAPAEVRAER